MKIKKKWIILFFVLLLTLSFCFIGTGIYFSHLATPQYIMNKAIDEFSSKVEDFWHDYDSYRMDNNYSLDKTIKVNLDSEYLAKESATNIEALKSYQFLNNLNKLQNHLIVIKDGTNNKAFVSLEETISNEELLNVKYVIDNSTKYYYVKSVLDNYVNDGNCNYFESLNANNTSTDNIEYLYNFIKSSLKNNLKKEYFESYNTKDEIAGKNHSIHYISLKLTDKNIKQILKDILKDLKKDEKANKILTGIDNNFEKTKINAKKNYLNHDESYDINIYTSTILYKPMKYEIIHLNKNNKKTLAYEKNKKQDDLYLIEDNKVTYHTTVKHNNDSLSMNIFDSKENKIGSFQYEKNDLLTTIDFDFDNSKNKYQLKITSKTQDLKENNSYNNSTEISIKHIRNKISMLNGTILINTDIQKKVNIIEDTSNAILASTLTSEQQQQFKNVANSIIERLERP